MCNLSFSSAQCRASIDCFVPQEVLARKAAAEEQEANRKAKMDAKLAAAEERQAAVMLAARQKAAAARQRERAVARRASESGAASKSYALLEKLAAAESKRQSLLEQRAETARSAGASPAPPAAEVRPPTSLNPPLKPKS